MTDFPAEDLALAAEFPPSSRDAWLALVTAALKGAPFERKLVGATYDRLRIDPLYERARDARPVAARPPAAPWQVLARVDHPDPAAANEEARHELANGATGVSVVFAGAIGAYGFGLPETEAAIEQAFADIHPEAGLAIECDLGPPGLDVMSLVTAVVTRRGIMPQATGIRFGLDPLGTAAAAGRSSAPWAEVAPILSALVIQLASVGFRGPFAAADARAIHAAGGSETQELAFALAGATAYLRALEAYGMELDDARRMIFFRLAADADQFLTVAKFRALRRLWARVEEACGLEPRPAFVSAETAWRMMTRRDPAVNMLRTTVAAFAAGIGGADAVTVLPFTAALGLPDRFARRIARNAQLILLEEANIAKVADPAAGSGAIEHLTTELCGAAWALFQEIEAAGGAAAALEAGLIQRKVADMRARRQQAVARRSEPLTGTSEFAQLAEATPSVLPVAPLAVEPDESATITFEPLPAGRLAEPYEALRGRSDRMLAETGTRPKIFLANLGPPAAFSARAGFAQNFFAAGGIETVTNDGFAEHDAMAAAFRASGTRHACLCSSDEIYLAQAVAAAKALAAAGSQKIYLAGRPGDQDTALRAAGVAEFIHVGCDVPATLGAALESLGEA